MESSKILATYIKPIVCHPTQNLNKTHKKKQHQKMNMKTLKVYKGLFRELYNVTINILFMVF
jgi:hypothetical protein